MGNSYQRQDVSNNIANGNIINADDLDAEFNALEGAFTAVTGHSHDGTAGEGGPIRQVGPAQDLIVSASQVLPKTDNTLDLGSASFEFKDLWIDGTANIDSLVADTADINGGTIDGTVIGATTPAAATITTLVATSGSVGGVAITTASNTQTLTNKTLDLTSNTLITTSAQLRTAVTDETGTGSLVFADSPALAGTPTAPTAVAGTNTTQVATTAHVFAERSNATTLTNKTLTSPTINGGSISGITDLAVADGGTGVSTITGIIRGNGTSPFSAAVAGTDFLAPAAIGTTVQAFDGDLSAVAGLSTNGLITRTGAGTANTRTLTAGGGISITNGDGVAGNPVIAAFDPQNLIINGAFDFWQRGASFTTSGYGADRWGNSFSGGSCTMSRQSFALGDTLGSSSPTYYLRQSVSGQTLASHLAVVQQLIEGVRSCAGQTITVLGWARRASGSGNMAVSVTQNFGTGGSPSAVVDVAGQTVSLTGSFAPFAVTFAIPSVTGKTLGANGNDWLGVNFWTSAGSNFNAQSNSLGLQTIGVDFWGVHIKLGTHTVDAVSLYKQPELGPELARCQRYCILYTGNNLNERIAVGQANSAILAQIVVSLPVEMRGSPSASTSGSFGVTSATGVGVSSTGVTMSVFSKKSPMLQATTAGSLVAGDATQLYAVDTSSRLILDAEL